MNEVHFDNVCVSAVNLIVEEKKGWTYAKFLLNHQHSSIANVQKFKVRLEKVKSLAKETQYHDGFDGERIGEWFETNTGPHYFNNRILNCAWGGNPFAGSTCENNHLP